MEAMWKAIIQDMLDAGLTPEEIKDDLRERYPEVPELMVYVDHLIPPTSTVLGFCKKSQFEEGDPDWWRPEEEGRKGWKEKWLEEFLKYIRFFKKGEPGPDAALSRVADIWKVWANGKLEDFLSDLQDRGAGEEVQDKMLTLFYTRLNELQPEAIEAAENELRGSDVPSAEELGDMFKFEGLKGLCRKAQMDAGFGYGNEGQTNFSVPNSEGEAGSGTPIDPTSAATPSSSYTDHIKHRVKLRKEQEEEQQRRERRKELLKDLREAQMEPGGLLKKRKQQPQQAVPTMQPSTPKPGKDTAEQWKDVSKELKETTMQTEDTTTTTKDLEETLKDTTKQTEDQGKKMDTSTDEVKEFGDAAEQTTDKVEKLRQVLEDLVRP